MTLRALPVVMCAALLWGCGDSSSPARAGGGSSSSGGGSSGSPTALVQRAETVLPPGQSGFVSTQGQAAGRASGNPGDYGPHIDDQRELYWNFDAKPATLGSKPGTAEVPKTGVEIYRDSYGVPIVYAPNTRDAWYGVGYAVAADRLFLMDAVRRTARGTLAELTGCSAVPADLQQRVLGYTAAEYQALFDGLSPAAKDAVLGYVDGANAWIAKANADPNLLPAEYGLLSSQPQPVSFVDVLAAGVYITRFVASEGGNEFLNIRKLRLLEQRYGRDNGRKTFMDLTWQDDPKAAVSVPGGQRFSNHQSAAEGEDAVFNRLADWALTLPETIWRGDGTGHSAVPSPCSNSLPSLPAATSSSAGLAGAAERMVQWTAARISKPTRTARGASGPAVQRQIVGALNALRAYLHGGSYAFALGASRTQGGGTMMVSGPQLGYSYPLLLVEYEVHAPGLAARGSSVPILPVVGIGYTDHAAWGLTTGYSKTIDSFIETLCTNAQQQAGTCAADTYRHQGQWKPLSCRTETINYRPARSGVPFGSPSLSQSTRICRTVHGPIVAQDNTAGLARSVSYAMWLREIDTIEGIIGWNTATSFAEFDAAMAKVTWNENTTVATRDGHIAYYHPGLHPLRPGGTDQRFPTPGDGSLDFPRMLRFDETPQSRDPAQGYLVNWNNKPALGWRDGEGLGDTSRPGGAGQRMTALREALATTQNATFADLKRLDQTGGTVDPRFWLLRPSLVALRNSNLALTDTEVTALDLMLGWDGLHYGPGITLTDPAAKDGPAATVFGEMVASMRDTLFKDLRADIVDPQAATPLTIFALASRTGSHVFDVSVMDNLTARILTPASSGLLVQRDWLRDSTAVEATHTALKGALQTLATTYNSGAALTPATLNNCRRIHPRSRICSITGVIGPGSTTPSGECVTMPYQDRGSWIHRVGWERP